MVARGSHRVAVHPPSEAAAHVVNPRSVDASDFDLSSGVEDGRCCSNQPAPLLSRTMVVGLVREGTDNSRWQIIQLALPYFVHSKVLIFSSNLPLRSCLQAAKHRYLQVTALPVLEGTREQWCSLWGGSRRPPWARTLSLEQVQPCLSFLQWSWSVWLMKREERRTEAWVDLGGWAWRGLVCQTVGIVSSRLCTGGWGQGRGWEKKDRHLLPLEGEAQLRKEFAFCTSQPWSRSWAEILLQRAGLIQSWLI